MLVKIPHAACHYQYENISVPILMLSIWDKTWKLKRSIKANFYFYWLRKEAMFMY